MHLFPHAQVRDSQKEFMALVQKAVQEKKHVLAHAPTGLGKTAAVLAPTIKKAIDDDLTVFFLTGRHTQHTIVLETVREIKNKHNVTFPVISLIGKKHMCAQAAPKIDFLDYCKSLRENKECSYYENYLKGDIRLELLKQEINGQPANSIVKNCSNKGLCPYEVAMSVAKNARVIVADYYYIFQDAIREVFMKKAKKTLSNSIVIVDEAHNLPSRLRKVYSSQLTSTMLKYAIKEAKKYELKKTVTTLSYLQDALNEVSTNAIITKQAFEHALALPLGDAMNELAITAEYIREQQKRSSISGIARFLEAWHERDKGFARIAVQDTQGCTLKLSCLDPGLLAAEVFDHVHSSILMSGTLIPLQMFRDVLGLPEKTLQAAYPSPFPQNNKKVLIIPSTTTKYSKRNSDQYASIASHCASILENVPGPGAIFLPSYGLRNAVLPYFEKMSARPIMLEEQGMDNAEKRTLLEQLTKSKNGVLIGVAAGSFGEGIDLPGVLKCVIIVGLPLTKPDLESKSLIDLYDQKFGKGWEYGYTLPALNKVLQNAGRCIRSETDKGIIILLDERFAWPSYKKCLPEDWHPEITTNYDNTIKEFFA